MQKLLITGFSLVLSVGAVTQDVCWDQSNYDESVPGVLNQEVSGALELSTYGVSDIQGIKFSGSIVRRVTVYYTYRAEWIGALNTSRVNLFDKIGPLPLDSDDPRRGTVVPVQASRVGANTMAVIADNLDFVLSPGNDYWVGLAPIADSSLGEAFQRVTTAGGSRLDHDGARNPEGGRGLLAGTRWGTLNTQFGTPSDRDLAIKLEGSCIPEPTTLVTLGGAVVSLAVRARRRRLQ